MPKIGVIAPNDYTLNDVANINWSILAKKYVELVQVSDDPAEIMQDVIRIIGFTGDVCKQTHKCMETHDMTCYLIYTPASVGDNSLSRYLTTSYDFVSGKCVLMVYTNKLVDITHTIAANIFRNKFMHKSVIIKSNGNILANEYTRYPYENTELTDTNCGCYHVPFMGRTMCVFIPYNPNTDQMNVYATLLCKQRRINGDVVVSLLRQYPHIESCDVDPDTFRLILAIKDHCDPMCLSEDELHNNFYQMVIDASKKYGSDICENIPPDIEHGPIFNYSMQ
jgi:hypothetical protein